MRICSLEHAGVETDPLVPALYTSVFVFAMHKANYESLPPDLKAVLDRNSSVTPVISSIDERHWIS